MEEVVEAEEDPINVVAAAVVKDDLPLDCDDVDDRIAREETLIALYQEQLAKHCKTNDGDDHDYPTTATDQQQERIPTLVPPKLQHRRGGPAGSSNNNNDHLGRRLLEDLNSQLLGFVFESATTSKKQQSSSSSSTGYYFRYELRGHFVAQPSLTATFGLTTTTATTAAIDQNATIQKVDILLSSRYLTEKVVEQLQHVGAPAQPFVCLTLVGKFLSFDRLRHQWHPNICPTCCPPTYKVQVSHQVEHSDLCIPIVQHGQPIVAHAGSLCMLHVQWRWKWGESKAVLRVADATLRQSCLDALLSCCHDNVAEALSLLVTQCSHCLCYKKQQKKKKPPPPPIDNNEAVDTASVEDELNALVDTDEEDDNNINNSVTTESQAQQQQQEDSLRYSPTGRIRSDYEVQRLERVLRNERYFKKLGLSDFRMDPPGELVTTTPPKKKVVPVDPPTLDSVAPPPMSQPVPSNRDPPTLDKDKAVQTQGLRASTKQAMPTSKPSATTKTTSKEKEESSTTKNDTTRQSDRETIVEELSDIAVNCFKLVDSAPKLSRVRKANERMGKDKFRRPRGRAPANCEWDSDIGEFRKIVPEAAETQSTRNGFAPSSKTRHSEQKGRGDTSTESKETIREADLHRRTGPVPSSPARGPYPRPKGRAPANSDWDSYLGKWRKRVDTKGSKSSVGQTGIEQPQNQQKKRQVTRSSSVSPRPKRSTRDQPPGYYAPEDFSVRRGKQAPVGKKPGHPSPNTGPLPEPRAAPLLDSQTRAHRRRSPRHDTRAIKSEPTKSTSPGAAGSLNSGPLKKTPRDGPPAVGIWNGLTDQWVSAAREIATTQVGANIRTPVQSSSASKRASANRKNKATPKRSAKSGHESGKSIQGAPPMRKSSKKRPKSASAPNNPGLGSMFAMESPCKKSPSPKNGTKRRRSSLSPLRSTKLPASRSKSTTTSPTRRSQSTAARIHTGKTSILGHPLSGRAATTTFSSSSLEKKWNTASKKRSPNSALSNPKNNRPLKRPRRQGTK